MSIQPRRGRKQDLQLTRRVVEAAYTSLSEESYKRVSLEGVARRAEVSRTAIYKRWPTIADLLLDVAVHALEVLGYSDDTLGMQQPDTGTLAGDLHAYLAQGMRRLALLDGVGVARPLLAESILDGSLGNRVRATLFKNDELVFTAILEAAMSRNEIVSRSFGAEHLFQALVGYGIFRAYLLHAPLSEDGLEHVATSIAHALIR